MRQELLSDTREVLARASELLATGALPSSADGASVLGLYEALCRSLEGIDGDQVRDLLGRIASRIEALSELSRDVERVRSLRSLLRED